MKKKEPNVLSTLYQKPAPVDEIIEGSKQIGYQAYQDVKKGGQHLLSEAASWVDPFGMSQGGSRWINQKGPDGETVLGVGNKPISTREHNLLSKAALKQSVRSEKIDLSDDDLLTQELQRLTALSNKARNDNFANMWTEAAIYLRNKKASMDEAGESTQFGLINSIANKLENAVEKKAADEKIKENNNNTLTKTAEQKSEDQARIDFLSKNTPANRAFRDQGGNPTHTEAAATEWDKMRWEKFGKPNYESNLLKKDG